MFISLNYELKFKPSHNIRNLTLTFYILSKYIFIFKIKLSLLRNIKKDATSN